MNEMEEKKGEEVKKDSLIWNEEDYDAMQKITGFDEESIEADQKKGISVIIFSVVCIICLIIGLLIGYSLNKKPLGEKPNITVIKNPGVEEIELLAFYSRMNASSELYLYALNEKYEETSLLDLTNLKYAYQYVNKDLFVLLEKDGLNLYDYSFSKDGYHREVVKTFDDIYDAFYFRNNLILIKNKNAINIYDIDGKLNNKLTIDADQIYDYTKDYIVYAKDGKLNIYYIKTNTIKKLTNKVATFLCLDNDQVFYNEKNKLYSYSIIGSVLKEITTVKYNSIFEKIDNYYMFNDGKTLYYYGKNVNVLKEFDHNINEIAYLDKDNIVLIFDNYNINECNSNKFNTYSIPNRAISEKTINGCLNTQVINDLVIAK